MDSCKNKEVWRAWKMKAVKFVAEVAEEHAIEAGAEDVTSVEGDDQV
jgi:hypothetical protein